MGASSSRQKSTLTSLRIEPGYKRVAGAIEEQILNGQMSAGDVLPTENELADILGVHRSTVREGIRALENAGLVQRGAGKRLRVSAPGMSEVSSVMTRALGMKQVSFTALWEMQMLFEPFAARLAAQRIEAPLAQALRDNVAALRANLMDDEFVLQNDIEFHQLVTQASKNPVLTMSTAPISALLFSATVHLYESVEQARFRLLEAHEALLGAIVGKDVASAETWMTRHIKDFRRGYEMSGVDAEDPIPLDPRALRYVVFDAD